MPHCCHFWVTFWILKSFFSDVSKAQNQKGRLPQYRSYSVEALRGQKQEMLSPWVQGPRTTDPTERIWGETWCLEVSIWIQTQSFLCLRRGFPRKLALHPWFWVQRQQHDSCFQAEVKSWAQISKLCCPGHSIRRLPAVGLGEGSCELCPEPAPTWAAGVVVSSLRQWWLSCF